MDEEIKEAIDAIHRRLNKKFVPMEIKEATDAIHERLNRNFEAMNKVHYQFDEKLEVIHARIDKLERRIQLMENREQMKRIMKNQARQLKL